MGKTTLALNIADRVAKRTGPVLFISLEMDVEQLEAKRAARESGVPGNKLLMQRLTDTEYTKVAQAADVLALGAANGWVNGSCRKDYGGNDRAVLLQKPEKSC